MRRTIIKALGATLVFGTVLASASSLGPLASQQVGAADQVVTACDTNGVATGYDPVWNATTKRYEIASVEVSDISDLCDGRTLKVTVTDDDGDALGSATGTIPDDSEDTSHALNLSAGASSEAVGGVHVSIS